MAEIGLVAALSTIIGIFGGVVAGALKWRKNAIDEWKDLFKQLQKDITELRDEHVECQRRLQALETTLLNNRIV